MNNPRITTRVMIQVVADTFIQKFLQLTEHGCQRSLPPVVDHSADVPERHMEPVMAPVR
ncbi:hypothetical protein GCM10007298_40160 [Williamsia phyllosphaerae]|uniref:Uncharacterized protein n=1 Tax=Williamsia phyllosphaerae TaxID=885042 RepID=A0ABQ1V5X0_9NOCA|nr:hypothetical protein GCM10007298_40160 [Williamsia phyllosphaerae]